MRRWSSDSSIASGGTLFSHTSHSEDGYEDEGAPAGAEPPDAKGGEASVPAIVHAHGGAVKAPYMERGDVGAIGILTGNWGGNRANKKLEEHIDNDLKTGPSSIIMLQEAQEMVVNILQAPAVAAPQQGGSGSGEQQRASYEYIVLRGNEHGNTLLMAGRAGIVDSMQQLRFDRRCDGRYKTGKDKGKPAATRAAYTRAMVADFGFKRPVCGHDRAVFCNVHFHHLTAKRAPGFAKANDSFWTYLASTVVGCKVRFLCGDFNMSLFEVVGKMRERKIDINLLSWFPWRYDFNGKLHLDSCGIFVVGGVKSITLVWDFSVFTGQRKGQVVAKGLREEGGLFVIGNDDDEDVVDQCQDPPKRGQPLLGFTKGHGYEISSYLPKGRQMKAVEQTLTFAVADGIGQTKDWTPLPTCKQKKVDASKFDPDGILFRSGAHMPLLAFVGDKPRRSVEAIERREQKRERSKWGKGTPVWSQKWS